VRKMNTDDKIIDGYGEAHEILWSAIDLVCNTKKLSAEKEALIIEYFCLACDAVFKIAAKELGQKGGKRGGDARAKALSPERRTEIARMAAKRRWGKK
jgi:hypothetical protein